LGVPRAYFFDNLDSEVDASITEALAVLQKVSACVRDATLPAKPDQTESVRSVVRAAEAYAYHFERVKTTPDQYQPETLARILSGANVTTPAYIQARRDLASSRRIFERAFENVDVLVTPTLVMPAVRTAEMNKDLEASTRLSAVYIRNIGPFDAWGIPAISIPCGFTRNGLPIGLQIAGPNGGEQRVLQLAHAFEQATDWHKRSPLVQ
jgi:Asp-tRNA(Asn)/Glu-tRNA(Gln) amidotransferase A subunit family amidase